MDKVKLFKINSVKLTTMIVFAIQIGFTQDSFPGCTNVNTNEFELSEILKKDPGSTGATTDPTIHEPLQIDFDPVMNGTTVEAVDVYYILRQGSFRRYDGSTKAINEVANFNVITDQNHGLRGFALHPDFKTNRYIFVYYTSSRDANNRYHMRLSRFVLKSDNTLDMPGEKILFELVGGFTQNHHHGGPMTFDRNGYLWVTIGNNSPDHNNGGAGGHVGSDSTFSDEWGPSNTASLRGSILKILPDDSPKGYTVPSGNFGEYWADYFETQGNSSLAAEYRDPAKMLPEIFSKGHRSNFSIAAHPTEDWMAYGEVNPGSADDEFHIFNQPFFAGYPYFYGNQKLTDGHSENPAAPINDSPLSSGIQQLPPAIPGTIISLARVAITGPIYVYDSTLQSSIKFPPHFTNYWFNLDFSTSKIWTSKLNGSGGVVSTNEIGNAGGVFQSLALRAPLDAHFGPDGALYVLNMAGALNSSSAHTGIVRLGYIGPCQPMKTPVLSKPAIIHSVKFAGTNIQIKSNGIHQLEIRNIDGKTLWDKTGFGEKTYKLNEIVGVGKRGVVAVIVKTETGKSINKLFLD